MTPIEEQEPTDPGVDTQHESTDRMERVQPDSQGVIYREPISATC